jgi:hypothetical protein
LAVQFNSARKAVIRGPEGGKLKNLQLEDVAWEQLMKT